MTRADAFALLKEYVKDPGLVRHMQSVEIAMRAGVPVIPIAVVGADHVRGSPNRW